MTDDEVHGSVVRWVRAKTKQKTIKAYQSGKMPEGRYCMVNLTGALNVREQPIDTEYVEDAGNVSAAAVLEREWRFSVHAYGEAPTDTLRPILAAMHVSQALEPQYPTLLMHEASQIRHVPDWINNAWQPRAQMDLIVRGIVRDTVGVVDVIETYSIEINRAE
ncbi:phage neck terminator protein [Agrobacterium larrymoorei]|uniref:phage neck terminator protein n=1 Tax=Agrobacterium larrymoorei TaxID=160699 RepID=UPI0030C35A77